MLVLYWTARKILQTVELQIISKRPHLYSTTSSWPFSEWNFRKVTQLAQNSFMWLCIVGIALFSECLTRATPYHTGMRKKASYKGNVSFWKAKIFGVLSSQGSLLIDSTRSILFCSPKLVSVFVFQCCLCPILFKYVCTFEFEQQISSKLLLPCCFSRENIWQCLLHYKVHLLYTGQGRKIRKFRGRKGFKHLWNVTIAHKYASKKHQTCSLHVDSFFLLF